MTHETVRLVISGRVQGVGYRAWLAGRARQLGCTGWVRNRRDGSVEALVHAPSDMLSALVADCRQGPAAARVESVVLAEPAPDELRFIAGDFAVLPTL